MGVISKDNIEMMSLAEKKALFFDIDREIAKLQEFARFILREIDKPIIPEKYEENTE